MTSPASASPSHGAIKEEDGAVPCQCGGKGLGANGYHYPGAHGCLRTSPPETALRDVPPLTNIQSTLHCEWSH